MPWGS